MTIIFKKRLAFIVVIILAILPLILCSLGMLKGIQIQAGISEFDFLAVAIALATYVATVRFLLIGRLGSGAAQSPLLSKVLILSLIPADFNLIVSGMIMVGKLFCSGFISNQVINEALPYAAVCFVYAVLYLALQHVLAWILSVLKFFEVF